MVSIPGWGTSWASPRCPEAKTRNAKTKTMQRSTRKMTTTSTTIITSLTTTCCRERYAGQATMNDGRRTRDERTTTTTTAAAMAHRGMPSAECAPSLPWLRDPEAAPTAMPHGAATRTQKNKGIGASTSFLCHRCEDLREFVAEHWYTNMLGVSGAPGVPAILYPDRGYARYLRGSRVSSEHEYTREHFKTASHCFNEVLMGFNRFC